MSIDPIGGIALAWLVIKELLAMQERRSKAQESLQNRLLEQTGKQTNGKSGEQSVSWWEMKLASLIRQGIAEFYNEKRDAILKQLIVEAVKQGVEEAVKKRSKGASA